MAEGSKMVEDFTYQFVLVVVVWCNKMCVVRRRKRRRRWWCGRFVYNINEGVLMAFEVCVVWCVDERMNKVAGRGVCQKGVKCNSESCLNVARRWGWRIICRKHENILCFGGVFLHCILPLRRNKKNSSISFWNVRMIGDMWMLGIVKLSGKYIWCELCV